MTQQIFDVTNAELVEITNYYIVQRYMAAKRRMFRTMDFDTAVHLLKSGRRIRRASWDKGAVLFLRGGKVIHSDVAGLKMCTAVLSISWEDILASDWELA